MNDLSYNELKIKYEILIQENKRLKDRIHYLEKTHTCSAPCPDTYPLQESLLDQPGKTMLDQKPAAKELGTKPINKFSLNKEKISLFMSLFNGRNDVYAKRWKSKKGKTGYSPVCLNEWVNGICKKPAVKCFNCNLKAYSPLDEKVIESHLRGRNVIGIYPMNLDETCDFLAMDFDKQGWEKDITMVRNICEQFGIFYAVERSRSGNGGHVWFFFKDKISAYQARKFGTSLLTYSMEQRHEIPFRSYDRLFPNQDTMPKGGLGNLIALPLQHLPRQKGNSLFIDKNFKPYTDQWKFISNIQRLVEKDIIQYTAQMGKGKELGIFKKDNKPVDNPWIKKVIKLTQNDFPATTELVDSGMIYIRKSGFTQKALNILKRFAAFQNPQFYKNQAMRQSTHGTPRIISCSQDFDDYLALPRGCKKDITTLMEKYKVTIKRKDETNSGRSIQVEFKGALRPEQQDATDKLLKYDNGVLSAATAFGKTVIGARLISLKKTNTLVLVHRKQLLSQWVKKLSKFLIIHEKLAKLPKKRGRQKEQNLIGRLGAGKNQLSSIVDVAIMQSVYNRGNIKDCIKNYGMIIVDECHHVPAVSFEQILKNTDAKYVYGLTATPARPDGHHPIIFFYCGPVRFLVDAKTQAEKRPFEHYLIPRFTPFKTGTDKIQEKLSLNEIKDKLLSDEIRNQLIIDDIIDCYKKKRTSLVLTGRVAHVEALGNSLAKKIENVICLTGGMGNKKAAELLDKISSIPANKPFVLVATGSYIGEGFDEPRLDTLFLTMPIAWKGTLQQYAGRLHRLCQGKKDVQIFDYVDIHVRMLENMYGKRLKGYKAIGYKAKVENFPGAPKNIIFGKDNFFTVYLKDIENALSQILIVSPFVTKKRFLQMMQYFEPKIKNHVKITIITRPAKDFDEEKKPGLETVFTQMRHAGINLVFKSSIHQKFAIIDNKTSWYGSINLLSFGYSQESIMRLESTSIAHELAESIKLPSYKSH